MPCDNIRETHKVQVLSESSDAIRAICIMCKAQAVFRKDPQGRMDNRAYGEFFKRDLLQPGTNLYYKAYPGKMAVK